MGGGIFLRPFLYQLINRCHPERSRARCLRPAQSKDLRLPLSLLLFLPFFLSLPKGIFCRRRLAQNGHQPLGGCTSRAYSVSGGPRISIP